MSDMDEFLDDDNSVYYDPDEDDFIPEGTYPANVVDIFKEEKFLRNGNKADIYKPTYKIDSSVEKYGGLEVRDKGIWRFRNTSGSSKYRGNKGNREYKTMLEKFGIELDTIEKDGRILIKLPELTLDNASNHTLVINVWHESFKSKYSGTLKKIAVARVAHVMKNGKNDEVQA